MLTDTGCTVYNMHTDEGGSATVVRTYLAAVHWESRKGVRFTSGGDREADETSVYIPAGVSASGKYLRPTEFAALGHPSGFWTLDENTHILKGEHPTVTGMGDFKALLASTSEQFRVTAVHTNMYGSAVMHHWEVTGK